MVRQVAGGRRAESSRNLLRPTLVALADNGGGPLSRSPPRAVTTALSEPPTSKARGLCFYSAGPDAQKQTARL